MLYMYTYYGFEYFMNSNCKNIWWFNDITVQHHTTAACGYHCMMFCVVKKFNIPLETMYNFYTNDLLLNDYKVVEWAVETWGNDSFVN